MLAVYARLDVCGLVELKGPVLPGALLDSLAAAQRAMFESGRAAGGSDDKVAVERWKKRFEMQVPLTPPFTDKQLAGNPLLLEVVRLMLGPRVEIDTFSQVTALPGAPDQPWHKDVDVLFKEPNAAGFGHHPAVGLVAVVPLVNITEEIGPTEFLAGSHLFGDDAYWEAAQQSNNDTIQTMPLFLRPLPSLGSVLFFDLRARHHGTRNQGAMPRSILYLSFVKDWYLDRLNFRGYQSDSFDTLPGITMKKLFRRVDTRTYVAALEDFAAGRSNVPPRPSQPFREPDLAI